MFILDRGQLPWSGHSPEARAIHGISINDAPFRDDMVHESAKLALQQRRKYARWPDDDDAVVVANVMLSIIGRALNMLKSQIEAQGRTFEENGRFGERLMAKRIEARGQPKSTDAPDCPNCGKPMRRRKSVQGDFWGCSAFPDCKGTRSA